jgi:hypothetical protein
MKYRADYSEQLPGGSLAWFSRWVGGPTLAKVENCHWETLQGDVLVTAFVSGEADTYFSIPAYCHFKGCRVRGYLTGKEDGSIVFRHTYY